MTDTAQDRQFLASAPAEATDGAMARLLGRFAGGSAVLAVIAVAGLSGLGWTVLGLLANFAGRSAEICKLDWGNM